MNFYIINIWIGFKKVTSMYFRNQYSYMDKHEKAIKLTLHYAYNDFELGLYKDFELSLFKDFKSYFAIIYQILLSDAQSFRIILLFYLF